VRRRAKRRADKRNVVRSAVPIRRRPETIRHER
jgi:hypothetical protein